MALNLVTDPWIRARRRSGAVCDVSPAEIVSDMVDDPVAAPAWGMADLDACTLEFLVALCTTAGVATDATYRRLYETPPSVEELRSAIEPLAPYFDLRSFMQDDGLDAAAKVLPVSKLFLNQKQTRGIRRIGAPAAGIAAFVYQSWALQGGRGHKVSVRGGGPRSTILVSGRDLWRRVLSSVSTREEMSRMREGPVPPLETAFPWMRPFDPAKRDGILPEDVHPAGVFWATSRRIDLRVGAGAGVCDLTGMECEETYTDFSTEQLGYGYPSELWRHPLASYVAGKDAVRPVRPKAGDIGFRDYLGLVVADAKGVNLRPGCVEAAVGGLRRGLLRDPSLLVNGFVSESARVDGYVYAEIPLERYDDEAVSVFASGIVPAQAMIAFQLKASIRQVQAPNADKVGSESGIRTIEMDFHRRLEGETERLVDRILSAEDKEEAVLACTRAWLDKAREIALEMARSALEIDALAAQHAEDRVKSLTWLRSTLLGFTKEGREIFAVLDLPAPPAARKNKSAAGSKAEDAGVAKRGTTKRAAAKGKRSKS